jgi:hypothetical protein
MQKLHRIVSVDRSLKTEEEDIAAYFRFLPGVTESTKNEGQPPPRDININPDIISELGFVRVQRSQNSYWPLKQSKAASSKSAFLNFGSMDPEG